MGSPPEDGPVEARIVLRCAEGKTNRCGGRVESVETYGGKVAVSVPRTVCWRATIWSAAQNH